MGDQNFLGHKFRTPDFQINFGHLKMLPKHIRTWRFILQPSKKSSLKAATRKDRDPETARSKKKNQDSETVLLKTRESGTQRIVQKRECESLTI